MKEIPIFIKQHILYKVKHVFFILICLLFTSLVFQKAAYGENLQDIARCIKADSISALAILAKNQRQLSNDIKELPSQHSLRLVFHVVMIDKLHEVLIRLLQQLSHCSQLFIDGKATEYQYFMACLAIRAEYLDYIRSIYPSNILEHPDLLGLSPEVENGYNEFQSLIPPLPQDPFSRTPLENRIVLSQFNLYQTILQNRLASAEILDGKILRFVYQLISDKKDDDTIRFPCFMITASYKPSDTTNIPHGSVQGTQIASKLWFLIDRAYKEEIKEGEDERAKYTSEARKILNDLLAPPPSSSSSAAAAGNASAPTAVAPATAAASSTTVSTAVAVNTATTSSSSMSAAAAVVAPIIVATQPSTTVAIATATATSATGATAIAATSPSDTTTADAVVPHIKVKTRPPRSVTENYSDDRKETSSYSAAAAVSIAEPHTKATINKDGTITLANGQIFEPNNNDIQILKAIYGPRVRLDLNQVLNLLTRITEPKIRIHGDHVFVSAPQGGRCVFIANKEFYSNSYWNMVRTFLERFGISRELVEQLP